MPIDGVPSKTLADPGKAAGSKQAKKKPTAEQLEAAAAAAAAQEAELAAIALAQEQEAAADGEAQTEAKECNVYGGGLEEATVRQHAFFWIEAVDAKQRKRTSGGDSFFVAIRGPSVVRARVLDNGELAMRDAPASSLMFFSQAANPSPSALSSLLSSRLSSRLSSHLSVACV